MKKFVQILTSALMVAGIGLSSTPVMAENAAHTYTAINGTTTQFNKYLIVDERATTPTVTFTYGIAPGSAIAYGNGTFAVLAGNDRAVGGTGPTVGTAVYTEGDAHTGTVAQGDVVTLDAGEHYVKKVVTIDFSNVTFSEPGVYRWLLTENTVSGRTDILYDTQDSVTPVNKQRVLDVYITDNGSGTLVLSQYVLHSDVNSIPANSTNGSAPAQVSGGTDVTDKSTGFVNEWLTSDVEFGKEVIGNQGSKDKYFEFQISIAGAQAGHTYNVDITDAQATIVMNNATKTEYENKQNPTSITVDANGAGSAKYYLKDSQYVKVLGLPVGATYTLTEVAEDYKSIEAIATDVAQWRSVAHTDPVSATIVTAAGQSAMKDYYTGFTNQKNGVIPTGVAVSAAGAMAVAGIAVAGLLAKRKKEDEE